MKFSLHCSVCHISSNVIPVSIEIYNTLSKIMQQVGVKKLKSLDHILTTEVKKKQKKLQFLNLDFDYQKHWQMALGNVSH